MTFTLPKSSRTWEAVKDSRTTSRLRQCAERRQLQADLGGQATVSWDVGVPDMPVNQLEQEGSTNPPLAFPVCGKKTLISYTSRNHLKRNKKCITAGYLVPTLVRALLDGIIIGNSSSHHCVRTQITLKWLTYLVHKLLHYRSVSCRQWAISSPAQFDWHYGGVTDTFHGN